MKKIIFIFLLLTVPLLSFFWLTSNQVVILSNSSSKKVVPVAIQWNDIVGHITIPGTGIDEAITQTSDNEYYLTHNEKKEEDKEGSVFIDYRNKLKDQKLLIYGHNSKRGTAPLKELENYLEESYYQGHQQIILTLEGIEYSYNIFSVMLIPKDNYQHTQVKFKNNEYEEHLKWLKESSRYNTGVEVEKTESIIVLQTCYYEPEEAYLLINAKRSDYEKQS